MYTLGNALFMLVWALLCLAMPMTLLFLKKFVGLLIKVILIFEGIVGVLFFLLGLMSMFGQFLRGKCVLSRPKMIELVFNIYVFKKPEVLATIENPAPVIEKNPL